MPRWEYCRLSFGNGSTMTLSFYSVDGVEETDFANDKSPRVQVEGFFDFEIPSAYRGTRAPLVIEKLGREGWEMFPNDGHSYWFKRAM